MRPAKGPPRRPFRQAEGLIKLAVILIALAIIGGCAKVPTPKPPRVSDVETLKLDIRSKGVTMQAQAADGKRLWTIYAASGSGDIGPGGDTADLKTVSALLYEQNKPAIYLSAAAGRANEATGKLLLTGGVKARSADGRTALSCDRITWQRDARILIATGNVNGASNGMSLGPADEARAKFRAADEKMTSNSAAAIALVSLALQGKSITYKDRAGNMDITAARFRIARDEKTNLWRFDGTGPLTAKWKKQGLTITGDKMEGTLAPVGAAGSESFELRSGKFSGNIRATMSGTKGNMDLVGLQTWSANLSQDEKTWLFTGEGAPFIAKFPDNGVTVTGRRFEGTAARNRTGTTENPEWETARFSGGVKAVVTQKDKKTGKTFTITGECPNVTITRATRKMVLTGGVRVYGNHPSIGPEGADVTAGKITITFDSEMQRIIEVEMEGS